MEVKYFSTNLYKGDVKCDFVWILKPWHHIYVLVLLVLLVVLSSTERQLMIMQMGGLLPEGQGHFKAYTLGF